MKYTLIFLGRMLRFILGTLWHIVCYMGHIIWYLKPLKPFDKDFMKVYQSNRMDLYVEYYASYWDWAIGRVSFTYEPWSWRMDYDSMGRISYPVVKGRTKPFKYAL